jgi:hypothetical protein
MKKYLTFGVVALALVGGALYSEQHTVVSVIEMPTYQTTQEAAVSAISNASSSRLNQHVASIGTVPKNKVFSATSSQDSKVSSVPQKSEAQIAPIQQLITLSVEGVSHVMPVQTGTSLLDAMRELSTTQQFTFTGSNYASLGFFVESINGKKAADGYNWIFYINGKESGKGVSSTVLNSGDTVLWKYEKGY